MNLNQVTIPAINIEESVTFYRTMGFKPIVLTDSYARFESIEGDSTFSIDKIDSPSAPSNIVIYFEVDDLAETHKRLLGEGIVFKSPPRDEEWLWSEARLLDPAGNQICIYHAGDNRKNPPWKVGV
ncbi:hypothetical protein NBRC116493_09110 [Aurantivibrio infirmus]